MRAATRPQQRPSDARLLVVDAVGRVEHDERSHLARRLAPGDLLVANDAATLPASLRGRHVPTCRVVEVRLAGWPSADVTDPRRFRAVVFGAGDFRTRTEDRPPPPQLRAGDLLELGPLTALVTTLLGHPRLVEIRFAGTRDEIWAGLARHGRPIQYAHLVEALELWDVWTRLAARPVAFEPPSAGFLLDWRLLEALAARHVGFATLTHAAGISSTGDPQLDARLPFDEPYHLPAATVDAIERTRATGGRVVALGTTVTRALEHAARSGALHPGPGLATGRLGPGTPPRVVDEILTGTHEPGESHYELLRAFAGAETLAWMSAALEAGDYRAHEFGDSALIALQRGPPVRARADALPSPRPAGPRILRT